MTFQLEVGKTYLNRDGEKVEIMEMRAATAYRYRGDHGICYTAGGRFDLDQPEHGFDLVEECEPDEMAKEEPKAVPLCEAIVAGVSRLRFKGSRPRRWLPVEEVESEILKHFAALSVEDVARVLCGWRDGKRSAVSFDELPEAEKAAYCDQAQAAL